MPHLTRPSNNKTRAIHSGIGFCSGLIVSSIFQPLEVLKMAIIFSPKMKGTPFHKLKAYTQIVIGEHGLRGFWNGLTPAILRSSIGNILYFLPLRMLQQKCQMSPFVASGLARIVSCAGINPLTVLETRFVMPGPRQHKNLATAVTTLYRNQGIKSFWKGTLPSCIKQGIFAGIYYQLYQTIKNTHQNISLVGNFLSGFVAGCCATVISHPFEVVRAKIQSGKSTSVYSKLSERFRHIYQQEGASGFMKGVTPRLARKPLINATTFLVYQSIEKFVFDRVNPEQF